MILKNLGKKFIYKTDGKHASLPLLHLVDVMKPPYDDNKYVN